MYLVVTEFRFDTMLYSNLSEEYSDAVHIKCSRKSPLAGCSPLLI